MVDAASAHHRRRQSRGPRPHRSRRPRGDGVRLGRQIDAEHGGWVAAEYPQVLDRPEARSIRFASNAEALAGDWLAVAAEIDAQIAARSTT